MTFEVRKRGILVLVAAAAAVAGLTQLAEWDTFYHLAYGRDLVRRGGFAPEEPLLYPFAGAGSGVQPSWLGSLVIYGSWLVAGLSGPSLLVALLTALLLVVLAWDALDGKPSMPEVAAALVPVAFALAVLRDRATARPEQFSNLLVALTMIALRRWADGRSRALVLFPLVAILWMNLHHSLLAGIGLIAIFVAVNAAALGVRRVVPSLLVEVPSARALLAPAGIAAAGLVAAAVANPDGLGPLRSTLEVLQAVVDRAAAAAAPAGVSVADAASRAIDELRPVSEQQWRGPFGWIVAITAAGFVMAGRRANLRELVTVAIAVVLAARAQRFMGLAAIIAAPIAARNLRAAVSLAAARWNSARWVQACAGVVCCAMFSVAVWQLVHVREARFGTGLARGFPVRAVEYLRSIGFDGRLFNTFHFGGFLAWSLNRKVFQDGRGLLRPEDALAAVAGPSAMGRFATLDARYRFDALVVHYPQFTDRAYAALTALPPVTDWGADRRTWALVAFDDGGQVYLRRDGRYSAEAARDEFRYATPTNSLAYASWPDRAGARADLERSLRETPDCRRCQAMLGYLELEDGRLREARSMLERALEAGFEMRLYALLGLARVERASGDRAAEERYWRQLVAIAPDPSWSRRQLASVLLEVGRLAEAWEQIGLNLGRADVNPDDLALAWRIATARGDDGALTALTRRIGSR